MEEVELLKIGSIMPDISKSEIKRDTIMIAYNGGPIFDYYISILKDKCGDEYGYLKTDKNIIGDIYSRSGITKGIPNNYPIVGESYRVGSWQTSIVVNVLDNMIIITKNSVYAIHSIRNFRDKQLNNLGIN